MRLRSLLSLALLPALASADALDSGFDKPPLSARPMGWWHWINGSVTKTGIDADLDAFARAGLGGVQLFDCEVYMPPGSVRYGTENWFSHVEHAIHRCAELGLEFHLMNTPGWSASGGPWITEELSMKHVVWSETKVSSAGAPLSVSVPRNRDKMPGKLRKQPRPLEPTFYRDIALLAVPAADSPRMDALLNRKIAWGARPVVRATANRPGIPREAVLDLTASLNPATENITVTLPPGEWTLIRFGFTSTGVGNHPASEGGEGLEADKLDPAAIEFQFNHAILPLVRRAGPLAGKTFNGILFDSFEAGFQNWTANLPAAFRTRKNYDLIPWLPLLTGRIIADEQTSEAVLADFRDVIDNLIAENYFGTMQRLAHAHGLKLYSESQGGALNPAPMNRFVDVPMNEFWMPGGKQSRASRIRQTVSTATFNGAPIVAAESFTAKPEDGKWQNTPHSLKRAGDEAFSFGINKFIFHSLTHQPYEAAPGFSLGRYGTHIGRLNTWWPNADAWIAYLSRSQFLLQQGRVAADICFLADDDLGYGGLVNLPDSLAEGFDYQIATAVELAEMSVNNDGTLSHPKAGAFRLLVTPGAPILDRKWSASVATLRKLRQLVAGGAALLGNPPSFPAGLADIRDRAAFDALVAEIWGDAPAATGKRALGKGLVFRNQTAAAALDAIGATPDVAWKSSDARQTAAFLHRTDGDTDIYFLHNLSENAATLDVSLRQRGRIPEIWDAATGRHRDALVFRETGATTTLPLAFEPRGSLFVIFRKPLPPRWATSTEPLSAAASQTADGLLCDKPPSTVFYSDGTRAAAADKPPPLPAAQPIATPWKVTFPDGRGAPAAELVFPKLISWPDHPDDGVRHYSGTALYKNTFDAAPPAPGQVAVLDLGQVADIARVFVNGREAGVVWREPCRLDITKLLRAGKNTLEIRVANRWINRLIGDERVPAPELNYQRKGVSKFTDGRLLKYPEWLGKPGRTAPAGRHSFAIWKHYDAADPLVPSGLLGPVRLEHFYKIEKL
ncbi:MAG: hypothetical protein LBR12_03025 [Opitutaceae bacterium]|jgi:hypothetical protein|nr:hypothetical protein [Opitutaceae bacterium]